MEGRVSVNLSLQSRLALSKHFYYNCSSPSKFSGKNNKSALQSLQNRGMRMVPKCKRKKINQMSDSESQDSDEGIRYKTESVRNKMTITKVSSKITKYSHREDKERSKYRKRYSRSRSPPSRKRGHKKDNKRIHAGRSSSTSSSDERNKTKFAKKISKRENIDSQKITKSQLQKAIKLENQEQLIHKDIIGPALPPHLLAKQNENPPTNLNSRSKPNLKDNLPESVLTSCIGPELPTHMTMTNANTYDQELLSYIGPQLPPHLLNSNNHENNKDKMIGSSLTPHLPIKLKKNTDISSERNMQTDDDFQSHPSFLISNRFDENDAVKIIGPSLPPYLQKNVPEGTDVSCSDSTMQAEDNSDSFPLLTSSSQSQKNDVQIIGPSLAPHLREKLLVELGGPGLDCNLQDEEEDIYGPLPDGSLNYSVSHKALEERALLLKIDQLGPKGTKEPVREQWMTELPAAKAAKFGLGPRQFRNRSGPDLSDRSSWTDLPGDKNKKQSGDAPVDLKAEAELRELRKRDEEQETLSKKHKRKQKSLLKIHKEKLEQEKKDEKSNERRPFSRDIDLQVNRFDEAQKKAIMKKAQLLDDRFSSGKSKYL